MRLLDKDIGKDLWHKGINQETQLPCGDPGDVRWRTPGTSKDHRNGTSLRCRKKR